MHILVPQKMIWHFASEEMILWVQQRFPSLFINVVTFIRANLSRRTSFNLASNCCWPLFSTIARNLPSLWKRVLFSSLLLAVTGNCEGVGGRVALQPCSVFSVQYAIALAGVSKFTASTAGILSPRFSMGQGRLSEARKKSSKLVQRRAFAHHESGRAYLLPL